MTIKGRQAIRNTLLYSVVFLLALSFLKLPRYNEYVYYICGVLLILESSLLMTDMTTTSSMVFAILYAGTVLIPLAWLAYTNTAYQKTINDHGDKIDSYNELTTITNIILVIQTILLGYSHVGHSNITMLGAVLLSIINTFIAGVLWEKVAFFITDG